GEFHSAGDVGVDDVVCNPRDVSLSLTGDTPGAVRIDEVSDDGRAGAGENSIAEVVIDAVADRGVAAKRLNAIGVAVHRVAADVSTSADSVLPGAGLPVDGVVGNDRSDIVVGDAGTGVVGNHVVADGNRDRNIVGSHQDPHDRVGGDLVSGNCRAVVKDVDAATTVGGDGVVGDD